MSDLDPTFLVKTTRAIVNHSRSALETLSITIIGVKDNYQAGINKKDYDGETIWEKDINKL